MITRRRQLLVVALFVLLARASLAQGIGSVALIEGTVEVGRGSTWTPANMGTTIAVGDQIRTDAGGRVRIVFQDGSVLNIGTNTQVSIEQQSTDTDKGIWSSRFRLLKGRIRPLVGDYYQKPGALSEIETPTAITGVRGTEFIMTYDPVGDVSQVVGVTGTVAVHSVMDRRRRRGVMITADQLTVVARGKFPTPPERVPSNLFREYIEDLQFIGTARSGSAGETLLASRTVPPPDRPGPLLLQPGPEFLPGQPQGIEPDPSSGGVIGQPGTAVQPSANLGIHF